MTITEYKPLDVYNPKKNYFTRSVQISVGSLKEYRTLICIEQLVANNGASNLVLARWGFWGSILLRAVVLGRCGFVLWWGGVVCAEGVCVWLPGTLEQLVCSRYPVAPLVRLEKHTKKIVLSLLHRLFSTSLELLSYCP